MADPTEVSDALTNDAGWSLLGPEYSIAKHRGSLVKWAKPYWHEQLYEGLRKAGLPEE